MGLIVQGDIKKFDTTWYKHFPNMEKEEMFDVLSNNIYVDNKQMEYLNASVGNNNELDFYHDKLSEMRYSFFISINPIKGEIIQKHFYPNTPIQGKYAQFLYNQKIVCGVNHLEKITFFAPNKKIAEDLERIGAIPDDKNPIMWKFDFKDTAEMELYFERKNVKRLSGYEGVY